VVTGSSDLNPLNYQAWGRFTVTRNDYLATAAAAAQSRRKAHGTPSQKDMLSRRKVLAYTDGQPGYWTERRR